MAPFFQFACSYSVDELQDLLLRRYHDMNYILSLEPDAFMELAETAVRKDLEEQMAREWYGLHPHMILNEIKYMSLEEYIDRRTGRNIDTRPAAVIEAEIEELHRKGGAHGDI